MRIFRLKHIYDTVGYTIASPTTVGYFSSYEKAIEAIDYYRSIDGYKEYPNGFIVEECFVEITDSVEFTGVYEAFFSFSDNDDEYEYQGELGVFASEVEAERAIEVHKVLNSDNILKSELKKELETL